MNKTYLIKTKYGTFQATVRFGKRDNVYFVSIPTFSGVFTEARSLSEAKRYAGEIIELQCLAALDDGKIIVDDTRRAYGKFARPGALAVTA